MPKKRRLYVDERPRRVKGLLISWGQLERFPADLSWDDSLQLWLPDGASW